MITVRAVLLWIAIIPFAVANGVFREKLLSPLFGAQAARLSSGIILSFAVVAWTMITIRWIGRLPSSGYIAIGALWLVWTVTFEFAFGRLVGKHSWTELLRAYRFADGDIWPVVLLVIAASPSFAAKVRGLA